MTEVSAVLWHRRVGPRDDPPTDGLDAWGYETYDGRFGDTPFYRSR